MNLYEKSENFEDYDGVFLRLVDTTCPICGKNFVPAYMHIYKQAHGRRLPVCSYSCMLKSEKIKT